MFTHNISPVILDLGPFEIRYYGLLFAIGALLYYLVTRRIFKREKFPLADFDDLVIYLFVGLVVGARLGHVFFYNASYYLSEPLQILKVWQGGLSSHGAAIGVFLAYLLFCYFRKVKFAKYADPLVIAMPLIAGFVRLGNFFNSEIVGRQTDAPWGVVFAQRGEDFARHPVQLYEGGLLWAIFALMICLYMKKKRGSYFFMFLFMGLYFGGRFCLEFFKEYQVFENGLTMGQWLSLGPVLLAVGWFLRLKMSGK